MAFPLRVELIGVVFEEGLTEAVDAPQRRPQIVGDRVAEGFELAVDRVGLDVRAPEPLLRLLYSINVRARAEPACDSAGRISNRERASEKPVVPPVALPQAVLDLVGIARLGGGMPVRETLVLIVGVDDIGPARVAANAFGAARILVPTPVVVVEMAVGPRRPNDLGHRVGELSELPLTVTQSLLRTLSLGDIGVDAGPFAKSPVLGKHRHGTHGEVSILPVLATQTVLDFVGLERGSRARPCLDGRPAVVGMYGVEPSLVLVLRECLSGVSRPAELFAHHLAPGIVGPDDLGD